MKNILIINICKEKLHYVRNSSNLVISEHPKVRRKINTGLLYYEFVKPVCDILNKNGIEYSVKHYKELSKEDLKKAEKIIICGTSLYDNNFINDINKFNWIKKIKKPILGICGGMQIIGLVFGGRLRKKSEKNKNFLKRKTEENKNFLKKKTEIGFFKEDFIKGFLGLIGFKEVYHLHNYYVDFRELKEFEVFSESRVELKKISQAVKLKEREVYGVLFHPEARNKELIEKFCEMI